MRMHNKLIFKFFFTAIFIFGFFLSSLTVNVNPVFAAECTDDFRNVSGFCVRDCANNQLAYNDAGTPMCFCPTTTDGENHCILENEGGAGGDGDGVGPTNITNSDFDAFNPLKIGQNSTGGTGSNLATDLSTPGGIISRLLDFAFPLAGLILFVMLVWGGFEMVYGANNTSKAIEAGKNRITTALIGFILLFASYWIMQLVEVILGITIF